MRVALVAACWLAVAGAIQAQEPETLDATHPSITKKPSPIMENGNFPQYPADAMKELLQGETRVLVCVDITGRPHDARLLESSGHAVLDTAVLDWLDERARFNPAEADGKPVAVCNYEFMQAWKIRREPATPQEVDGYLQFDALSLADRPIVKLSADPPIYPLKPMSPGAKGKVKLMVCFGPMGRLANIKVVAFEPGPDFIQPTVDWVVHAEMKPPMIDGKPSGVCGVPIEYDWKVPE